MSTYLAGHDPEAFPDAETVILDRAPASRWLRLMARIFV